MKRRHSKQRRISTAIMLLVLAIIFLVLLILSIINKEGAGAITFNVTTLLICLSIGLSLLFNKDEAQREIEEEERIKKLR